MSTAKAQNCQKPSLKFSFKTQLQQGNIKSKEGIKLTAVLDSIQKVYEVTFK